VKRWLYDYSEYIACFVFGILIGMLPIILAQPGQLRDDLREAESNVERSLERIDALRETIDELTSRQREAAGIIESASDELADAVERADRLTDLITAAIDLVDQLEQASSRLGDAPTGN
jgi:methyl-accepting chemotaxis protein